MSHNSFNQPIVSVIVPCYNSEKYISEALQSVLQQTFADWECVIVDDGSTDKSKEEIEKFTTKDKRFKYYYQTNKGVAAARNNAIKQSSGKYILPLDADDKIAPEYLFEALNVLEKNDKIKLVYCNAKLFGAVNRNWVLPDFSMKNILIENIIFCSAVFRKSDFEKLNGYNEQMVEGFEDWGFWLNLIKDKNEVCKLSGTYFFYRIKTTSRNQSLDIEKQKKLRTQIFNNHKELYQKYFSTSDLIFDLYETQNKLAILSHSKDYKIGKCILSPIRFLKKYFQNNIF